VDDIIEPALTRSFVAQSLEYLKAKRNCGRRKSTA